VFTPSTDLVVQSFVALRQEFFDGALVPIPFALRAKQNTQDDPLDEHIASCLAARLSDLITVVPATGPLTCPDMVVAAPEGVREIRLHEGALGTFEAVGIEVKKIERTATGRIDRRGGVDYNSTPPSRTIAVFYEGERVRLPGFYLFLCLEAASPGTCRVTALALCDGGVLNEDVELYESRTKPRKKAIGLGSYGDGLDRQRPMLVFANPLGWGELDRTATLIHRLADLGEGGEVLGIGRIERAHPEVADRPPSIYHAYRAATDVDGTRAPFAVLNPFPVPKRRSETTQARARFQLRL
jgi:hypothetical protein